MRFLRLFSIVTIMFLSAAMIMGQTPTGQGGAASTPAAAAQAPAPKPLTMSIAAFPDGTDVPLKYTAAGTQTSPAISWTNVPAGTMSFVLHFHDMEVARNRTTEDQVHWLVWNIPAAVTELPEGIPMGAQLQNGAYQLSASGPVYRGPGAPNTAPRHHYTFELFALDIKVDVQPGTDAFETRTTVMKAMQGHILGRAVYMGLFHRPQ